MREHDASPLIDFVSYPESEMKVRANAFYESLKRRHTIRYFSDKPVPKEVIETCLLAAGTAPSGANHQPWHFAVIGDPEMKRQIREAAEEEERAFYDGKAGEEWLKALEPLGTDHDKPFLEVAPWLIVIFAQRKGGVTETERRKNYYINESVGIATGFLITALHESGLGTLTHTPNPMTFLNHICQRPEIEKPYLILVAGHPSDDATIPHHAKIKKPLSVISSWF
jgi:iodotyrosine deiodinase